MTRAALDQEVGRVEASLRLAPVKLSGGTADAVRRDVLERLIERRLYSALMSQLGLTAKADGSSPRALVLAAFLGPRPTARDAHAEVEKQLAGGIAFLPLFVRTTPGVRRLDQGEVAGPGTRVLSLDELRQRGGRTLAEARRRASKGEPARAIALSLSDALAPDDGVVILNESSYGPALWQDLARTAEGAWSTPVPVADGTTIFYRLPRGELSGEELERLEVRVARVLKRQREVAERAMDQRLKREKVVFATALASQ